LRTLKGQRTEFCPMGRKSYIGDLLEAIQRESTRQPMCCMTGPEGRITVSGEAYPVGF
jgi:hypothetical protein